ncbi:MAG: tetratricopeptide repeat protein, partial [Gemmatimonadaceae bacterium]
MANASRLKKKAADFEAKRQHDRALAVYEQILDEIAGKEQEADIPLYNRAGDLYQRQGNLERAVTLYEKAVDLYSEGGFFNNAIALCNKILRHAPNRASIYYKLGKISAQKGFNSDAKQNFLEYAGRMQKLGKMDAAFYALREFADLCPSQDDVRLMLAEQLTRAGRTTEACEQLQILHEQLDAEGRQDEAAATVERLKALNP